MTSRLRGAVVAAAVAVAAVAAVPACEAAAVAPASSHWPASLLERVAAPVDAPAKQDVNPGMNEVTPDCRKRDIVWQQECVWTKPTDIKKQRRCVRLLNTFLQTCVGQTVSSKRHLEDVANRPAPSDA